MFIGGMYGWENEKMERWTILSWTNIDCKWSAACWQVECTQDNAVCQISAKLGQLWAQIDIKIIGSTNLFQPIQCWNRTVLWNIGLKKNTNACILIRRCVLYEPINKEHVLFPKRLVISKSYALCERTGKESLLFAASRLHACTFYISKLLFLNYSDSHWNGVFIQCPNSHFTAKYWI